MSRVGPREPVAAALVGRRSIADLLWVANTRHGPGGHWFARVTRDDGDHDHLATAVEAERYLVDHRVSLPPHPPTRSELAALGAIRAMVRGLLSPEAGWTPDVRRILSRTGFKLDEERRLVAAGTGWSAFIGDLMLPLLEIVGMRDRLAICGNPACRLVFLDESKSGTRRWCDDAGCGNRDRVKRYRRRPAASN